MRRNYIGNIYENNCGKFKVNKEIITPVSFDNQQKYRKFEIEFLDTGYKTVAMQSNLTKYNGIKDRYLPTIANVGYLGDINISIRDPEVISLYRIWSNIISRCYDNKYEYHYAYYGAKGITVDQRWFNFTNFFYDAKQLIGYENKLNYPDIYQLDKDYLQRDIPLNERIYSNYTCIWISKYDNIILSNENVEPSSGYRGVIIDSHIKNNAFYTIFEGRRIARFKSAEAAACYYNYLSIERTKLPHHNISLLNNVKQIPLDELMSNKHLVNIIQQNLNSSTTIPFGGEIPH